MDTMTIILIAAVAAIIGVAVTYFVMRRDTSDATIKVSSASQPKADSNASQQIAQLTEQKNKADKMLREAKEKIASLDQQLRAAVSTAKVDPKVFANLADTDKLNKKIKELQGELEDAEDDLADAEKKLKNKTSELSALNEKHDRLTIDLNAKVKEIAHVREELKNKQEELSLKMKSLAFVQEILSAKPTQTQDIVRLNKDIDQFESFFKGQLTDWLTFLISTNRISYNEDGKELKGKEALDFVKTYHIYFDQWAAAKRKSWLDGKTSIAFVGEFSAGKTTIVNRILSQDDPNAPLLPVDTEATTAIPTYIAGGPKPSYTFIADNKRKTIAEGTFKSVSKQVLDQVQGISSLIKYFVMTYKNTNLNGLSILDTPGFNSNDPEDAERTIEVINECDALFWVFDVNAGDINKTSIKQIKDKLEKPLYVVINKVDTKSKADVDKVEQRIKETLQREGIQFEGAIRFSDKAPVEDIMRPIKSITRNASRDTFVQDVNGMIDHLIGIVTSQHNELTKDSNTYEQNSEKLDNQIISCLRTLSDECVEAHNLPHWEEHLFRSDRYEMSEYEGDRLLQLLRTIVETRIPSLGSLLDDRIKAAHDSQQAFSDLYDAKDVLQKGNDCLNEFKRVTKNFK